MDTSQGLRLVVAGAAVLVISACGGDGDRLSGQPTATSPRTTPPVTAPPTQRPESEASDDVDAALTTLIEELDHYLANASDHSGDGEAWSSELVKTWPVRDDAQAQFENLVVAWANAEIEQVGQTVIADHAIDSVEFDDEGAPIQAASTACLDLRDLETVDYAGQPAQVPTQQHQTWDMTWYNLTPTPGWVVVEITISDEPC